MESKKTNKDLTAENLKRVDDLIENIKNMSDDDYSQFMKTCALFHNYSFFNQVLLFLAGAKNVKGFHAWQKIGRKVKKGAKAIWILAPLTYAKKDEDTGEEKHSVRGFKSVPVFDIKDTEGKELPVVLTESADVKIERLLEVSEKLGHSVEFKELRFSLGGYIDQGGNITINSVRQESDRIGTLVHELSHGLLKHHEQAEFDRALCEQEAETLAFLISDTIGIERKSECYLKGWTMTDSIKKSMKKINAAYSEFFEVYEKTAGA